MENRSTKRDQQILAQRQRGWQRKQRARSTNPRASQPRATNARKLHATHSPVERCEDLLAGGGQLKARRVWWVSDGMRWRSKSISEKNPPQPAAAANGSKTPRPRGSSRCNSPFCQPRAARLHLTEKEVVSSLPIAVGLFCLLHGG